MANDDEKPTAGSVTAAPCTCRWLARAADEPDNPVFFDAELNEFNLAARGEQGERGGYSRLYHCPFCGGAAPKSKRGSLFANITDAERRRLSELTKGVRTIEDALAILGTPDRDMPAGLSTQTPATDTEPATVESFHVISYTRLSETADVDFTDYGPTRGARMSLRSKYIGKPRSTG